MTIPTPLPAIVEALRSAGATEEMIAAAVKAGGESRIPHRARDAARKGRERAARCPPDMVSIEDARPPDTTLPNLRVRRTRHCLTCGDALRRLVRAIST